MSENSFIAKRRNISRAQKAWKFLRDVNSTSLSDLSRTAVIDGSREYTYGLMFREWDRYASVFSALGLTGENHSRTGILGSTCAEVIFSFYGLNMTGAEVSIIPSYSALTPKKIIQTIRNEHLTDFIVTDDFAQANLINDLLVQQKELGLRHVIVLHVPLKGVTVHRMLGAVQESKYAHLKSLYGPICMDELLKAYGNHPVCYGAEESADNALILHTSGTTGGAGKPVPLSDQAVNEAAASFYDMKNLNLPWDNLVTAVIVDLSNAYGMIDQVHLPFAMGAAVTASPGGVLNPWFYRAIPKYGITFLFTISAMFERWMKMPDPGKLDFSGLQFVALGGTAVSASDKHRYLTFMQEHGAKDVTLLNGYGVSELGGACILSSPDIDDEAIGYPLPGVRAVLKDEESGRFFSLKDAPCEGVLYLNSPSLALSELDGIRILETEEADGIPCICTNDLVRMDKDGKLTFLGRANRYFINDKGRKYESGRVETEVSRCSGIESCCVVPVYIKTTHDNIPMLCVTCTRKAEDAKETVLHALRKVFIEKQALKEDNLPSRILIAEELPRNGNGKIDLYKISKGEVSGDVYTLDPIRSRNSLTDFRLSPYEEGPADMIKEVFDGISAELTDSLPFRRSISNSKEENDMKNAKKAMESFSAMNQMGKQMMSNMMNRMGQGQNCGSMPDMQKMMSEMQKRNQKVMDMMPNMQKAAGNMAKDVVPAMQEQMNYMMGCMQQMNQMAFDMMQKTFDQHCKMMNQMFDMLQKMADVPAKEEAPAEEAKPAEEPAEEPAAEKPAPKKRAAKKNKG